MASDVIKCLNVTEYPNDFVAQLSIFRNKIIFQTQLKAKPMPEMPFSSILSAKLCLHPFLHLKNSLLNLFFQSDPQEKSLNISMLNWQTPNVLKKVTK